MKPSAFACVTDAQWRDMTDAEIAEAVDRKPGTAWMYRNSHGKPQCERCPDPTLAPLSRITDAQWRSMTNREIGRMAGTGMMAAWRYRNAYKKPYQDKPAQVDGLEGL